MIDAALQRLRSWSARIWLADGSMPCPGVYGIADSWPHVLQLVIEAGFDDRGGQVEGVFAGNLADVAAPGPAPWDGLAVRRVLGTLGTTFEALDGDEVVGMFEVGRRLHQGRPRADTRRMGR